ncbi:MAG: enoyl-CoA hydratase [Calditerrivibrio nitroreducens]|uniref:Enoyl-CoA hydratase n=1 Tax=Calditerrivibrio nitroreducens TaxID=477976 RepID=A0A2J6WNU0_9BACT|nr:MAG: enoyl-CoA hydratase [Calditerrivibrio nitroreducens]
MKGCILIDFNIHGELARIILKPEEKFNILSPENIKKLISTFKSIKSTQAKCILVYGQGGSFAVGANIKQMYEYDGYMAKGFSILGNKLFKLMNELPQIIIAEIDGFCMGGGVDFAASCDFRFATKRSKFAHPGAQLGIITGFGGTQRLPRLMKQNAISDLFLSGELFDANFMYNARFLNGIFDSYDELSKHTESLSNRIISKNKLFLKELKHLKYRIC